MKLIFKTIKIVCLAIFSILACPGFSFSQDQPQDPTSQVQEYTFKIDKLGDATLEVSTKMTQSQWEGFKQGPLVNDPSISKRDMERSMSTYVLEDFKRDIDDMNRTVKMSLKVKAMAAYKGSGNWEFRLGMKNPQVTKLPDNSMMITANANMNGQLVQQIYKVSFPNGASNIQQTTDSFGSTIFTYSYGGGIGSFFTWNNIIGVLLIIFAILIYVRTTKQEAVTLSINKRIANPNPPTPEGGLLP
jgi:hypothetical protein